MNRLWLRQIATVARLEVAKSLFTLRAAPLYLLAGIPVVAVGLILFFMIVFGDAPEELGTVGGTAMFYAHIYQVFILRIVIYTGCVWLFMNLFRGEVLDRSLHYYFLAPIRREVLVAGKFAAGLISAALLFVGTTVASLFLLYAHAGPLAALEHLVGGAGLGQLAGYVGVTLLACLGYGAVFLTIGLLLRNPIVPALLIFLWELINPFLPSLLKKISVVFYLEALLPVRIEDGPFAVIADPVSAWLAVPGLLIFAAVVLACAGWRIRRMEVSYGVD